MIKRRMSKLTLSLADLTRVTGGEETTKAPEEKPKASFFDLRFTVESVDFTVRK